jgi:hypothetical protein
MRDRKYKVLSPLGKPIIVAEMGMAGTQKPWVDAALRDVVNFPLVKALVWFNAEEPAAWPGYGSPNWSITPAIWHL